MAQIVVDQKAPDRRSDHDFATPVGRFLLWGGLVYLLVSVVDVTILWIGQRQDTLQFEFVALSRTAEAYPRFIVSTSLVLAGLWILRSGALWAYRTLAVWMLVLGFGAISIFGLQVLNYLSIASQVVPESKIIFRSQIIKTGLVTSLYAIAFLPLGVLGLRTRRRMG